MSMTTKDFVGNKNFAYSENDDCFDYKGGDSITPLIDTKKVELDLEGIEFWNGQGTYSPTMVECKIDYFTFNIPNRYISQEYEEYNLKGLIDILRLEKEGCDSKYNYSELLGFTRCIKQFSKSTTIIVNDTKRQNEFLEDEYLTRVELKGQGCREFESRGGNWKALINYIIASNGYLTRVDLAIDDKKVYFTPSQLNYYFKNRWFKSIFKEFRDDSTLNVDEKKNKGWGVLFGSKTSSTRLRIYDKKSQMISTGQTIDNDIKYWVRYEIRYLHDKAKSIIYSLRDNIMELGMWGSRLLKGCLTLLKKPLKNDLNKSRWETMDKWEKFLKDLEKEKIVVLDEFKHISTYATKKKWIESSCSKSLVMDNLICDDEDKRKNELELKLIGLLKLTNVDLNMVNKERSFMLGDITMNDIQEMIKKTSKDLYSYYDDRTWRVFKEKIETMFHATYEYLINACKLG